MTLREMVEKEATEAICDEVAYTMTANIGYPSQLSREGRALITALVRELNILRERIQALEGQAKK